MVRGGADAVVLLGGLSALASPGCSPLRVRLCKARVLRARSIVARSRACSWRYPSRTSMVRGGVDAAALTGGTSAGATDCGTGSVSWLVSGGATAMVLVGGACSDGASGP